MAEVINTHHFGDVNKLPATAVYVGRGGDSVWGNQYSSKSGKFTKEECVALHRVDLYRDLIADPTLFSRLKQELSGKDLACWCVNPKRVMACHAFNYLHVLSEPYVKRLYNRSIQAYLMEDLRAVSKAVSTKLSALNWKAPFKNLDFCGGELTCEIGFLFYIIKKQQPSVDRICEDLAYMAIELELLLRETEPSMVWYRVNHTTWVIHSFIYNHSNSPEPQSPHLKLKRKRN